MAGKAKRKPLSLVAARLCVSTVTVLTSTTAGCATYAQPTWFFLTKRLAHPAGIDVPVALGATIDIEAIKRAFPNFKISADDFEGISTISISYGSDSNVGVLLFCKEWQGLSDPDIWKRGQFAGRTHGNDHQPGSRSKARKVRLRRNARGV